jgi:hypothetical protein
MDGLPNLKTIDIFTNSPEVDFGQRKTAMGTATTAHLIRRLAFRIRTDDCRRHSYHKKSLFQTVELMNKHLHKFGQWSPDKSLQLIRSHENTGSHLLRRTRPSSTHDLLLDKCNHKLYQFR